MSHDQLVAPAPQQHFGGQVKQSNGLAVAGFVLALLGAMTSFIPVVNLFGAFLAFLGLIFGIIGLVNSRSKGTGKGLSIAAIVLAVAAFVISFAVNAATASVLDKAVKDVGAGDKVAAAVTPKIGQSASSDTSKSDSSFKDGVLTTPKMKIVITDHKIIPVGKKGNEYGSKPVIAFWYKITNLTDNKVSPTDWIFAITAYQDNNPNAENKLGVGSLPDARFGESQTENIKKGGTVENAMAYELDDATTPVDLVASNDLGMTKIGKVTYNLK